jgi:2-polyprenyl-3-methyl-5-hydroxy-6-metoxy-1,4-benzoquinol methylase
MLKLNKKKVIKALRIKYSLVNTLYIESYINHIFKDHLDNPLAALYIESELGAPKRQLQLVNRLDKCGYVIKNKKCLDIGCSNGALALACSKFGASDVLGIDISEDRLKRAMELCESTPVRFENLDILEQPINETFDVIFSTDVLEHIPDPGKLFHQIYIHLDKKTAAFAYFSLFNKYLMNNILNEPHYGVPGMILMPYEEAKKLWYEVRDDYKSKLDYEVYHWYSYWEYSQMAEKASLEMTPLYDEFTISSSVNLIKDEKKISQKFEADFKKKIEASPIPSKYRGIIKGYVNAYLEEFRQDHTGLSTLEDKKKIKYLFLKYYAQPLMMILKRGNYAI